MPSHLHAVIAFSNTGKAINSIVGNGKRFLAYDLVQALQQNQQAVLLYCARDKLVSEASEFVFCSIKNRTVQECDASNPEASGS